LASLFVLALHNVDSHIILGLDDSWEFQNAVGISGHDSLKGVVLEDDNQFLEEISINGVELLACFEGISDGHQGVQEGVGSGVEITSLKSRVGEDSLEAVADSENALSGTIDLGHIGVAEGGEESLEEEGNSLLFIESNVLGVVEFEKSGEVSINKAKSSVNQNSQVFGNNSGVALGQGIDDSLAHKLD